MTSSRIRVTAFTGGVDVPGARFRVRQYIPALAENGIDVFECAARFRCYPPHNRALRPCWALATMADRVPGVIGSYHGDVTLFQREMLSTMRTFERLTKRPRILDVDDAIWLHPRGAYARKLAEGADLVVCGNSFLADQFRQWNSNICIIPTAVDTNRYRPTDGNASRNDGEVIGWSGTSSGLKFLEAIEPALAVVLKARPRAKLRVVSDKPARLPSIPERQIEFVKWSESNEVESLRKMNVGLMPLDDSLWSRGKCSYKMLLYMACAIPVVVSPVGMNDEVLKLGSVGFGARSLTEWSDAINSLLEDRRSGLEMGQSGRNAIERHFSISVVAPRLAGAVRGACGQPQVSDAVEPRTV